MDQMIKENTCHTIGLLTFTKNSHNIRATEHVGIHELLGYNLSRNTAYPVFCDFPKFLQKCRRRHASASFQILPNTSFISHPTTQCFSLDTECVVKSFLEQKKKLLAEFERAENASRTANSNRTVLFTDIINYTDGKLTQLQLGRIPR